MASLLLARNLKLQKRKKATQWVAFLTEEVPGGVLLSHGETPHYHRRSCVSLLSSEWDQVGPQRYGRQAKKVTQKPKSTSAFQYLILFVGLLSRYSIDSNSSSQSDLYKTLRALYG